MSSTHSENTRTVSVAAGWPELAEGRRSWEVAVVEFVLSDLDYYGHRVADEQFGCGLTETLTAYQGARDLEATGRVDAATWERLTDDFGVVRQGHRGSRVRAVQYALNEGHGYDLAVDGAFGPATRTAVKAFQKKAGTKIDGDVGPDTFTALIDHAS